jgi:hypothetical protein
MRSIGRLDGTRGRILDRDSRRYGRTVIHATVEDFRWNGPYSNFWGSLGFIWVSILNLPHAVAQLTSTDSLLP